MRTSVSAAAILDILDRSAEAFAFPMLDNGYVYPAAARMALFRSFDDWAITIETFGFSPRAGLPDLAVTTIGSRVIHDRPAGYDDRTFRAHVAANPNWTSHFFQPIDPGAWQDEEMPDAIDGRAASFRLRGRPLPMPTSDRYDAAGVRREDPRRILVHEWARVVANDHRDLVLATSEERGSALPAPMDPLIILDDWHHPDLAASQRPSDVEGFVTLAAVLEYRDPGRYAPGPGNTHWSHWPDGGTM